MTSDSDTPRRRPAAIRLDDQQAEPVRVSAEPAAPRKPAAFDERLAEIAADQDIFDDALPPVVPPRRRRAPFASIALGGLGILVSLGIGLWIDGLIADLFARAEWLAMSRSPPPRSPCSALSPSPSANSSACAALPPCRTSRPTSPPSASRAPEDGPRRDRPPRRLHRPPARNRGRPGAAEGKRRRHHRRRRSRRSRRARTARAA